MEDPWTRSVTAWKGRVGFYAILRALGVQSGERVLVPGYTCVVVPSAVRFAGAVPVYGDIEPGDQNLSLRRIQAAVADGAGGRVRAVVVQHTYGLPADTAPVVGWASRRGIAVIEDCAHAVGARYRDGDGCWREVGTLGDAAFFSSQWSKPFTTGLGGWAVANEPELAKRLRAFWAEDCVNPGRGEVLLLALQLLAHRLLLRPAVYWRVLAAYRALSRRGVLIGSSSDSELAGEMPRDYAKRMSRLQEWVGRRQIARLDPLVAHRRRLKEAYDEALVAEGLPALQVPEHADPVLLRYPIRVSDKQRVLEEACRRRVELGDWFNHPLHPRGANVEVLGWRDGMCPEAERAAREVVNFPMHARIGVREVERAVRLVKPFVTPA